MTETIGLRISDQFSRVGYSTTRGLMTRFCPTYALHHSPLGLTCIMGAFFYCADQVCRVGQQRRGVA